jgi:hypothetical protein
MGPLEHSIGNRHGSTIYVVARLHGAIGRDEALSFSLRLFLRSVLDMYSTPKILASLDANEVLAEALGQPECTSNCPV